MVAFDHPDPRRQPWLLLVRFDRDFNVLEILDIPSTRRAHRTVTGLTVAPDGGLSLAYLAYGVYGDGRFALRTRAVARRIVEDAGVPRRRAVR